MHSLILNLDAIIAIIKIKNNNMKKIIDIIPFSRFPFKIKLLFAKCLLRSFRIEYLKKDILLYNELKRWIEDSKNDTCK